MRITLGERTEETVRIYFAKAQQPFIKAVLPQKAQSVEEALSDYKASLLPTAASYGRIIKADGRYIGDIWCYGINQTEVPNAMVSCCIFDPSCWGKGVGTQAISLFLEEVLTKYKFGTIGAFTFSDNISSIRALEKNGFALVETFVEDGRESKYFQRSF